MARFPIGFPWRGRILAAAILCLLAGFAVAEDKAAPGSLALSRNFQLTGFTHANYSWWEKGVDTFSIKRARLSLTGGIARNVKMKFQIDLAKSPVLLDGYADIALAPALQFRLGQFLIPFGLESRATTAEIETVQRSQVVEKFAPGRDNSASGRDIGAQVFGKFSVFEYMAGVFNGAGINKADTNERKDVSARIAVRPVSLFSVGASIYDGRTTPSTGSALVRRNRAGLDAVLTAAGVLLKAEYIRGRDGDTTRSGWFVQGAADIIPKKLQVVAKWDSYDPDRALGADRSDIFLVGLNRWLTDKTRIQANYLTYFLESSGVVNRALVLQLQAGF